MKSIAFLFPGQGSQFEGMGADLASEFPAAKERFAQADSILGWRILDLKKSKKPPSLDITLYTQPAVYVVSCVIAEQLLKAGIIPTATAGHSAGEYAALTAVGAWDFATGLRVIAKRAGLMHESKSPGAMAAVLGLQPDTVREVCESYQDGFVAAANYNSPKQTVITGEVDAVKSIANLLKEKGAKRVVPLPVSGAFHSPLMKNAQTEFRKFMKGIYIQKPAVAWVSNNTAQPESKPETIKERLIEQFCSPVRWVETMQWMESYKELVLEAGPGSVLCGLTKACCTTLTCKKTSTLEGINEVLKQDG